MLSYFSTSLIFLEYFVEIAFKDWLCIPLSVLPISWIVIGSFSEFNSPIFTLFLCGLVMSGRFMFLFVDFDLVVKIIWVLSCERILSFDWLSLTFWRFNWPIRSIHDNRPILSFGRFDLPIQCVHDVSCLCDGWDIVWTMRCHQSLEIFSGFITLSEDFLYLLFASPVDLFFFTELFLFLWRSCLFYFLFGHPFLLSSLFSLFISQCGFLIFSEQSWF